MNALLAETTPTPDTLWYKDAVIYQLHVKSFYDANDDGVGDFPGLIEKLPHIAGLGVDTIWLLPFYPSPRLDDGYDIADYCCVHPEYGTLDDFKRFVQAAHALGMRVITELVINHTSDQHAWFQRARRAPAGSVERDFYVWSDDDQRYSGTRIIFCDTEKSNWSWDDVAGAYYWHRFYSHQPDLNFDNPAVLEHVLAAMRFWLDLGVDGLRLDAVPYLVEREGTNNENLPETHRVLKRIRAEIDAHYPGRMLLAEANQWPEDTQEYFGTGDECHMAFHFPLMPRMYMAIAREDRFPITDILRQTPQIPENCQWAIFLRNHDELTLEMVTDSERDYLWEVYATDRRARLNLGIRRRLAPLLQRDRRRMELMKSLLLSMPGTPVLYYGDEIGMGDNIHLGDRHGVRTPMQWSPDRNGGFSRAVPESLVLPPIMDSLYGFQAVNVEAQDRDPHSLLHWMRRMLKLRRSHHAFGRGTIRFLYPGNRRVLAYLRELGDDTLLCVANLSRTPQAVELELHEFAGRVPIELTGGAPFPPVGQMTYLLTLPPYGFYWFALQRDAKPPEWHTALPEPLPDYVTLVVRHAADEIFEASRLRLIEEESLSRYLPLRRWFGGKHLQPTLAAVIDQVALPAGTTPLWIAIVESGGDASQRYVLPLGIEWEGENVSALTQQLTVARVRSGPRVGLLSDAFSMDVFPRALIDAWAAEHVLTSHGGGELRFRSGDPDALALASGGEVRWLGAEQSNSSLIIGERIVIKLVRRVRYGENPERAFALRLAGTTFRHYSRLLGDVVLSDSSGTATIVLAQQFIRNQGDAWTWTQNFFDGAWDEPEADATQGYFSFAAQLGRRLAELHAALAEPTDFAGFSPRATSSGDIDAWHAAARNKFAAASTALAAHDGTDELRERLACAEAEVLDRYRRAHGTLCTRIHGDFHLGQVLVASGDAYLIDFEGDPTLPIEGRTLHQSPLRDLAGLLRSVAYAANYGAATRLTRVGAGEAADVAHTFGNFAERVRETLLLAYSAHAPAGLSLAEVANRQLLTAFEVERAAHEVAYEAGNRPAWLSLGIASLEDALQRLEAAA